MKTVVVVGATGQVGTELVLLLTMFDDIRVVAVCRSRLAAALLIRCGVDCRIGNVGDLDDAARLLADADVVVDLTLPAGPEPQVRRLNSALVSTILTALPTGCSYVFASTYMVAGMRKSGDSFRWRLFARTSYGARKRFLERKARRLGRQRGRDVFVFRFGQVHGELQRVSLALIESMGTRQAVVPPGASNTVFVSTVAEGVVGVARGQESPGTYSLVSQPQMSWDELHKYLSDRAKVQQPITVQYPTRATVRHLLRRSVLARATAHRELLVGYLLPRCPDLEPRVRSQHLIRSARSSIMAQNLVDQPYAGAFVGEAMGWKLQTPSDPRQTAAEYGEEVRRILSKAAP